MANETMGAPALLDAAAQLIERALGQLDASEERRCPTCNLRQFTNWEQEKVRRELMAVPARLRHASGRLHGNEPQLMGLGDE